MLRPIGTAIASEVIDELTQAREAFPAMNSPHEGYAVILEELDELWEEVRAKPADRDPRALRAEAIQVAAMAIRFILDVADPLIEGTSS